MGIESSCDETAVSIIERGEKNGVINEQIKSQIPLHSKYGGIVPEIASRNHYEVIDCLTLKVLEKSNLKIDDIGLISLTQGPGLIGSLLMGLCFAKGLSFSRKIPIVPVDHINSHIESVFIDNQNIQYPLIALVVSGGHTSIFYQRSKFETEVVSKTRDDAVGEVLDKIAKFYNFGYPGGPIFDRIYKQGDKNKFSFTFPRMSDGSNDFSFSGYKTAVLKYSKEFKIKVNTQIFYDLISSFLNSVTDYLLKKTKLAAIGFEIKSVVVAGGVSSNSLLREKFKEEFKNKNIMLYLPSSRYCTDNASMIAWLGYEKYMKFPNLDSFDFFLNSYSRAFFKYKKKIK